MPREIVLGNQFLLVNVDKWLQVRDLFFPHVGEENHVQGNAHRIGVWADGQVGWLNEGDWNRDVTYEQDTLVSHAVARNNRLGVEVMLHDCVHSEKNVFLRRVEVKNLREEDRHLKVFFHQDFHIYGTDVGDTAYYDAKRNVVYHYKRRRYFLINAIVEDKCSKGERRGDLSGYHTGKNDDPLWEDQSSGNLTLNPVAHGNVGSAVSIDIDVEGKDSETFYYWIAVGKSRREVNKLNEYMMEEHPDKVFDTTRVTWERIANSRKRDFKDLGKDAEDLYKRSVLTVISNIDNRGAILAANDSDIMKFNRDNYSYCWPRDGALVALAMDKAGYHAYTKGFFKFCADVLTEEGCLLHKYNPDRSLGSTWHPWVKGGKPHLPIQEDETALTIHALWYHYEQTKDEDFAKEMYDNLVVPAAEFMCKHVEGGLPKECYDLWEEREGVLTFTVSTVIAGLRAAANFCDEFNQTGKGDKYREVADRMSGLLQSRLWDEESGMFVRMIRFRDGEVEKDKTPESSTYGVFEFGVLEANDPLVVSNMEKMKEHLWVDTDVGGMARYVNDYYHRVSDDVPGNPWFITTMWYAKWLVKKAKSLDDLCEAREIIRWVVEKATGSGMLPEQLDPYTSDPVSVSPLTWSHATFIGLVNDYVWKYEELS